MTFNIQNPHNNFLLFALSLALTDDDIRELKALAPNAAVLTSFEDSDTDTASEDTNDEEQPGMPEPLTALFSAAHRELSHHRKHW